MDIYTSIYNAYKARYKIGREHAYPIANIQLPKDSPRRSTPYPPRWSGVQRHGYTDPVI